MIGVLSLKSVAASESSQPSWRGVIIFWRITLQMIQMNPTNTGPEPRPCGTSPVTNCAKTFGHYLIHNYHLQRAHNLRGDGYAKYKQIRPVKFHKNSISGRGRKTGLANAPPDGYTEVQWARMSDSQRSAARRKPGLSTSGVAQPAPEGWENSEWRALPSVKRGSLRKRLGISVETDKIIPPPEGYEDIDGWMNMSNKDRRNVLRDLGVNSGPAILPPPPGYTPEQWATFHSFIHSFLPLCQNICVPHSPPPQASSPSANTLLEYLSQLSIYDICLYKPSHLSQVSVGLV